MTLRRIGFPLLAVLAIACGGSPQSPTAGPARVGAPSPPVSQPGSPIAVENRRPGGTGWQMNERAAPGQLEAYTGAPSVEHGEPIELHASADRTGTFDWELWRLGWYGGAGGRLAARGGGVPVSRQPVPAPDPTTGLVACRWPVSVAIPTAPEFTTGVYLVKLTRSDGPQAVVPVVIRSDEHRGAAMFQASFTTYQAYNAWGGKSLYDGKPAAVEVSFDRPFAEDNGSGEFFRYERWFVLWVESRGFDLVYLTNLDVDRDPSLLSGQRLFLSVGHDEYWSRREREAVQAALDAGTSLAFFSANASYWQIRLEPSRTDGRAARTEVCWKERAKAEDPQRATPLVTARWRDPPVSEPEAALIGVMFSCWEKSTTDWVVKNASAWPYEGTGLHDGDRIPGIVGYETDRTSESTPEETVVLSSSPVADVHGRSDVQEGAVRDLPSGAFVFAAGTIEWSWGLAKPGVVDPRVQRITENVLRHAGLAPDDPVPAQGAASG